MNLIRKFPLPSFFILAYLFTWTVQLTAIILASRQGMSLSNENNFLYFGDLFQGQLPASQVQPLFLFMLGAGPLISALIVTWVIEGSVGLRHLWQECTRWRVGWQWYLVVLLLPIGLSLFSYGVGLLASGGQMDYAPLVPFGSFLLFFLFMIVFTGITEEPGWRGFALPRLQRRYTAYQASWILGLLWGVWHFPFIIYYNAAMGIVTILFSFLALTLGIVGWTIINTWIYNNTSSVWIMILFHGWANTVHSYLVLSTNNMAAQSIYSILPWAIALILLRIYGKENLARTPRPVK